MKAQQRCQSKFVKSVKSTDRHRHIHTCLYFVVYKFIYLSCRQLDIVYTFSIESVGERFVRFEFNLAEIVLISS